MTTMFFADDFLAILKRRTYHHFANVEVTEDGIIKPHIVLAVDHLELSAQCAISANEFVARLRARTNINALEHGSNIVEYTFQSS